MVRPPIPCMCAAGRPCGKVITVGHLRNKMTVLTIQTRDGDRKIILDAAGCRSLIEALGGELDD